MRKIEMEFEHKKVQEEVITPFPKNNEDNKDTLQQKPHIIQKEMKGEISGNKENEGKKGQNYPQDSAGEYKISGEISGENKSLLLILIILRY